MRILILDLDTLRPDHLGCYGYGRATSPVIDRIAAEGVRFDQYYCSDAPCLPSRAALVTGQFGIHSGIVNHGGTAADLRLQGRSRGFQSEFQENSLWTFLRRRGFHTASVSPFAMRHSAWWFNAGFTETYDTGKGGHESAEDITPIALDWLDRHARQDHWVLHVNYWDPHTPYRAPEAFGNPFADQPLPAWHTAEILAQHRCQPGGHGSRELWMWSDGRDMTEARQWPRHPGDIKDLTDYRRLIDGYDCGIRHMDDHIGRLLHRLANAGILDDTAIIVTSDHGENLGELNCYAEHGTADAITHRIPMIIRWPGLRHGAVDGGLHYNLDLGPTLADLLGAEPRPAWEGQSYAATLQAGTDCGRQELILSQCCHGAMRGVRFGDWMYIRCYHDFYHLYPDEMLFNVATDPHELDNLASRRPDLCAEGAHRLQAWHDRMMHTQPHGYAVDPLQVTMAEGGPYHSRGELKEYLDYLRKTERTAAADALAQRHPRELDR